MNIAIGSSEARLPLIRWVGGPICWEYLGWIRQPAAPAVPGLPPGILTSELPVPQVVAELLAAGIAIESIQRVATNLEAVFLQCSRLADGVYR